jgi:hypothetical protein
MARPRLGGVDVERSDVLRAISAFDREWPETHLYDDWLSKRTYRYALSYNDRLYPPKRILNLATGVSLREFSGGVDQTNRFRHAIGLGSPAASEGKGEVAGMSSPR